MTVLHISLPLPFDATGAPCTTDGMIEQWFISSPGPEQARALCTGCQVIAECLSMAMRLENPRTGSTYSGRFGIWGGLTPHQRTLLHRRQVRAAKNARRVSS